MNDTSIQNAPTKQNAPETDYISTETAVEWTGLSPQALRRAASRGNLRHRREGRKLLLHPDDVQAYTPMQERWQPETRRSQSDNVKSMAFQSDLAKLNTKYLRDLGRAFACYWEQPCVSSSWVQEHRPDAALAFTLRVCLMRINNGDAEDNTEEENETFGEDNADLDAAGEWEQGR